jgi:hypothetical protein
MNSKALKAIISIIGLLSVLCVLGNSVAEDAPLFDLKRVADRPLWEVEKILGKTVQAGRRYF